MDAFTATPFAGNPAAVCVLPEPREDRWMQEVAREMTIQASMTHQTSLNGERIAHARFSAPHL
jgi:predicted PhzF superfamily epimerase YddE/YHI9